MVVNTTTRYRQPLILSIKHCGSIKQQLWSGRSTTVVRTRDLVYIAHNWPTGIRCVLARANRQNRWTRAWSSVIRPLRTPLGHINLVHLKKQILGWCHTWQNQGFCFPVVVIVWISPLCCGTRGKKWVVSAAKDCQKVNTNAYLIEQYKINRKVSRQISFFVFLLLFFPPFHLGSNWQLRVFVFIIAFFYRILTVYLSVCSLVKRSTSKMCKLLCMVQGWQYCYLPLSRGEHAFFLIFLLLLLLLIGGSHILFQVFVCVFV